MRTTGTIHQGQAPKRKMPNKAGHILLFCAWLMAIVGALAFTAIKLRNWGPTLAAPEQSDFSSYYYAALISRKSPQLLYRPDEWEQVFGADFQKPLPFLYMPVTAVIIQPISSLPFNLARRLWFWASAISMVGTVVLLSRQISSSKIRVMSILMLLFTPSTLDTLYLGQINGFLALLTTLSWAGYDQPKPVTNFFSGLSLGITCCIKPVSIGLALYALLHKRFTYLAGFFSGIALFFVVGLIALPHTVTRQYLELMTKMSSEFAPPGLTIFWNQSIHAFWEKVLGTSNSGWLDVLIAFSLIGIGILCFFALYKNSRHRTGTKNIDIAILCVTVLLCAPITWWHYLLIVTPVYIGVTKAYFAHTHALKKAALPLGYGLIIAQRVAKPLVAATGLTFLSSLMMMGLLFWFSMLIIE